jgi:hypothetical protein
LWICAVADSGPVSANVLPTRTGAWADAVAATMHSDTLAARRCQNDLGFIACLLLPVRDAAG